MMKKEIYPTMSTKCKLKEILAKLSTIGYKGKRLTR